MIVTLLHDYALALTAELALRAVAAIIRWWRDR